MCRSRALRGARRRARRARRASDALVAPASIASPGASSRPPLAARDVRLPRPPSRSASTRRPCRGPGDAAHRRAAERGRWESAPGVTTGEVLATLRAMADIQERFGDERLPSLRHQLHASAADGSTSSSCSTCRRDAAPASGWRRQPALDVVPLLESADALAGAGDRSTTLLGRPRTIAATSRAAATVRRSCSATPTRTRSPASLAAAWLLHRAQERARDGGATARRRADAVPRPRRRHRPRRRADEPAPILAQAPGSIAVGSS